MSGGEREALSVDRTLFFLRQLGCPNVRVGEGSAEWERTKGAYPNTPDLIAAQLHGAGDPRDFYIDVVRPTGAQYIREKAAKGGPAPAVVAHAQATGGTFTLEELGDDFSPFYSRITEKLEKYSTSRGGTPLVGVAMYFRLEHGGDLGEMIAAFDFFQRALPHAFPVAESLTEEQLAEVSGAVTREGATLLALPFEQPLTFLMWIADRAGRGPSILFLVNQNVQRDHADHPVGRWLRRASINPSWVHPWWRPSRNA